MMIDMKISIERNDLIKALGHVQNVVERRTTIPILSNVMLQAQGDTLTFVATDLDIEIQESAQAMIEEPGTVTAPAHLLYDIVRKLPDCLLYTSPSPRDKRQSRMPSSA